MRQYSLMIAVAFALLGFGQTAHANCLVIDQIDRLHIVQTRLSNHTDTSLFRDDIRQLRVISRSISDKNTLEAVQGNTLFGKGASFVRFLRDTQNLLQSASLDDAFSVKPHFTRTVRQNLQDVGGYLTDLRCTDAQMQIDQAERTADAIRGDSDTEDLQQVAVVLNQLTDEILQLRTLLIVVAIALVVSTAMPLIRRWRILKRRRAKRHNTRYPAQYRSAEGAINGMLMDINCHGTKLRHHAVKPLKQGTFVEISIEGKWTRGTVMWSNVHYSGVQFKDATNLALVCAVCLAQTQNGAPKDAAS